MRELRAKARKAKNDMAIDALAIIVNSSAPQLEIQSSTLVAAEDDADIRRYARICNHILSQVFPELSCIYMVR